MAGHTPGPWRVEAAGFGQIGGWTISDEANGFGLCTRAPWANRAEESAANARLIAAAPELLEAAQAILGSSDYADDERPLMRALRDAADKATGGTEGQGDG